MHGEQSFKLVDNKSAPTAGGYRAEDPNLVSVRNSSFLIQLIDDMRKPPGMDDHRHLRYGTNISKIWQARAPIFSNLVAGVNVLALINTHAAAALLYGIERDFANSSQAVVFYDMGATNTECVLVKYSTFSVKEAGVYRTYGYPPPPPKARPFALPNPSS